MGKRLEKKKGKKKIEQLKVPKVIGLKGKALGRKRTSYRKVGVSQKGRKKEGNKERSSVGDYGGKV